MPLSYQVGCNCGTSMIIIVEDSQKFPRIYCQRCRNWLSNGRQIREVVLPQLKNKDAESNRRIPVKQNPSIQNARNQTKKNPVLTNKPAIQGADKAQKKFDNYILLEVLGDGAMGKVYLAIDENTGKKVALKVLRKPGDPKAVDYFVREVKMLLKLKHPNIVQLHSYSNFKGFPYIAMEHIAGTPLSEMLRRNGHIPPHYAIQIINFILDALIYAAQFQIIHRDIKPANMIISENGEVKLIDLGISKILNDSEPLSKTGNIVGTGYYMPVEQLQDAKRADARADIYATGATLYHAIAGVPPYGEYGRNINRLIRAKMEDEYQRLGERCPELPKELVTIIEKAMAHDRNHRYATALEFKNALSNFQNQRKS